MKRILSMLALSSLILMMSCNKEDKTIEKDFQYKVSSEVALKGETVTFSDYSINVDSRQWTFEDGTPATSSEAVVNVTFNAAGEKKATLTVNYSDGTKDEATMTVKVLDDLSAEVAVAGLTEKGCAKKGKEVTFSLENVAGEPTSYSWTFPGGTPATSTEASPKVVWNDQINDVTVTCEITRAKDGAKFTATRHIIAGNYPLLGSDETYDVYGFERGNVNEGWYSWAQFPGETEAGLRPASMTIADGGANGTSKCMKLNISAITDGATIYELASRNTWPYNASLEVGKKYELSFWLKAEGMAYGDGIAASCYWLNVFSYCPNWLNDPLHGWNAIDEWKTVFGQDFVEGSQIKLYENAITSVEAGEDGQYVFKGLLKGDWTKYSFEFNIDDAGSKGDIFRNCYLAVGLSGVGAKVFIDEVQINLVEE
mgnify:FL=1